MTFFIQVLIMAAMRYINPITLLVSVFPAIISGFFIKAKETIYMAAIATGVLEAGAIYLTYEYRKDSTAIAAFIAGFISNTLIIFLIRLYKNRRVLQT